MLDKLISNLDDLITCMCVSFMKCFVSRKGNFDDEFKEKKNWKQAMMIKLRRN